MHNRNASTWESEARGSGAQNQPRIQQKILSQGKSKILKDYVAHIPPLGKLQKFELVMKNTKDL